MNLILIGIAILPVIILLVFIYRKDKYAHEPIGLVMKALFAGALSAIPAIILESLVSNFYMPSESRVIAYGVYNGFAVAGACEELSKLALLALVIWRRPEFDEYFDGIVYAAFVALGFAGVENIMYVFNNESFSAAISTGMVRAIISVPAHFLFGVMMGYFFSLAKFDRQHRSQNLFKAFLIPMLLHGSFDALLFISDGFNHFILVSSVLMFVFIIFDIKLWKWSLRRINRLQEWSKEQSFDRTHPFDNFTWDV